MVYVTHDQVEAMTLADRIVVLRAGRIEQQGTPIELYDDPDNLFVAGFIGSPRMNFLEATVTGVNEGGVTASLTAFEAPELAVRCRGKAGIGQKISVGIRPEHFTEARPDGGALTATAQVIEQLGGVSYVYAVGRDGETKVTIQQKGHARIAPGTPISVDIEPNAALAFDAAGLRL
jgi:lactose/L-arabinose transport system ATP-binding protein